MLTGNEYIEYRKVQVRLLDEFKKVCEKHNLIFWIDFGSLLGAIRDGKIIEWDDDIDVSMPIKDYKKFLEIGEKELPRDIFLQTPKTDKFYKQNFAKLCDCYSTYLHPEETGEESYHQGIYMDIFPSVRYPKMPRYFRKVLLYFTVRSRAKAVISREKIFINYPIYFICKFIWILFSPFKTDEVAQTVEDNGYYYSIPQTLIYPLKDILFEGKMYPAPNQVNKYLSLMYGENYLPLPPVEKRVSREKLILLHTPCKHPRGIKTN